MKLRVVLLSITLVACSVPLWADEHHEHFSANEKLGTVSFPISCDAAVQKPFERGVALLHSFWYDEAQKQFADIAAKDPNCAMAYWGQAMSVYHELWSRPTESDLKEGQQWMEKAQSLHAKTERERDYVAAL